MDKSAPGKGFTAVVDELRRRYGWRLDQEIGQGAFAFVFRESVDGIERAVKITKESLSTKEKALLRELASLELLKSLGSHPRIITLIRFELVLDHLVTVWELAREGTLMDRLRNYQAQGLHSLPLTELIIFIEQAAEGIDFLNSRSLFHRDIKPQNLFLFSGQVKLGDLGLLKLGEATLFSHTGMGTLGYLPPESYVLTNQPDASDNKRKWAHRTVDVYGLAATYVHLRTGQRPFGSTPQEIVNRQRRGQPCTEGMSPEEAEWVRRALSPDPDCRPVSALQFVQGLKDRLSRPSKVSIADEPFQVLSGAGSAEGSSEPNAEKGLPPITPRLARLGEEYLALSNALQQLRTGSDERTQAALARIQELETQIPAIREELRRLPLPNSMPLALCVEIYFKLVENPELPVSQMLKYRPAGMELPAFVRWLTQLGNIARKEYEIRRERQAVEQDRENRSQQLEQSITQVRAQLLEAQAEDLRVLLLKLLKGRQFPAERFPESWFSQQYSELRRRYQFWDEEEFQRAVEKAWNEAVQTRRRQLRRRALISALATLALCLWLAAIMRHCRPPGLEISEIEPVEPIEASPLIIRVEVHSPLGRPVNVQFRPVGQLHWQTANGSTIHVPDMPKQLELEIRAVDNLGFVSPVTRAYWAAQHPPLLPSLTLLKTHPEKGPIAGDPFVLEFLPHSPTGRPVYIQWRSGEHEPWQNLEGARLVISDVKPRALSLEFRAVDSKGFASQILQRHWEVFVPAPTLTILNQQPEKGPVVGESFEVNFTVNSPVGRPVQVEWHYIGEKDWRRLAEPKLHIPQVKGDSLALEFRAVDSKGIVGSVVQERWKVFVPVPTLKITKQEPPNGPMAGEPFTIEFAATSPVGRPVHVEWRYRGDKEWTRLAEHKLKIQHVKPGTLALEFRAVDSEGCASGSLSQQWEVSREVRRLTGHDAMVATVAVTPDGRYVISGGRDNLVRVWDWAAAKELGIVQHRDWVNAVGATPDGRYGVSASADTTTVIWSLPRQAVDFRHLAGVGTLGHREADKPTKPVKSIAISPDGRYVITGGADGAISVWLDTRAAPIAVPNALHSWRQVRRLTGHEFAVNSVAVTANSKYIVTGSADKTVRLWELESGKEMRRFIGHEAAVNGIGVTPDNRYVVSVSSDKTVRVWELESGKEVRQLIGHEAAVNGVAVTPDGRYVISASDDKTVRVWELASGKEVYQLTGHEAGVTSIAVTPDARYVVSGSWDKTIRVWYIGDLK
jgi:WD40 repeat protein/serine/threonine protein kinase